MRLFFFFEVLVYLEVRCLAVPHAECFGGRVHTDEQQVRRPKHVTGFSIWPTSRIKDRKVTCSDSYRLGRYR